jgi:hypothetical protein
MSSGAGSVGQLEYRSAVVQEFRPLALTIIAIAGMCFAAVAIFGQLHVWMFDVKRQMFVRLVEILGFGVQLTLLGSSLCCMSLRWWARWGMVIYGAGAFVVALLSGAASLSGNPLAPFFALVQLPESRSILIWAAFVWARLAWVYVIACLVVMFLPGTVRAFEIGLQLAHTAYPPNRPWEKTPSSRSPGDQPVASDAPKP